jgi:hypothetical protein
MAAEAVLKQGVTDRSLYKALPETINMVEAAVRHRLPTTARVFRHRRSGPVGRSALG